MVQSLTNIINWFIPPSLRDIEHSNEEVGQELLMRFRLFIGFSVLIIPLILIMATIRLSLEGGFVNPSIIFLFLAAFIVLGNLFLLKVTGLLNVSVFIFLLLGAGIVFIRAITTGGFYGAPISWIVILPMIAALLGSFRMGIFWAFFSVGELFVIFQHKYFDFNIVGQASEAINFVVLSTLILVLVGISVIFEWERRKNEGIIKSISRDYSKATRMLSLGRMAGGVAHEINNPLQILNGHATKISKSLKRMQRGEEVNIDHLLKSTEKIVKTSERICNITQPLQYFSKVQPQDTLRCYNFIDIIEEVQNSVQKDFDFVEIPLSVSLPPGEVRVPCDRETIEEVISNLLYNALDGVNLLKERWVKLEVELKWKTVLVKITDSGDGIPPEYVDHIFDPFFTTKSLGKGVGLGLSLCKGVAEQHGGDLFYNQKAPHTQFILELPIDT